MADFVSAYWHWFIVVVTLASIGVLFPLIYCNRGTQKEGEADTMGHSWDEDLEEYNNPLPRWWFNLFLITLIFGLVYLVLYPGLGSFPGLLNWSSTQRYEQEMEAASSRYDPIYEQYATIDAKKLSRDPEAMKTGERLFANNCAMCHGSDARGAPGFPNLRDQAWLYGGEPEQIKQTLLAGRRGVMPGWESALGEQGVNNVTQYVLSLSGRDHDAEQAQQGKTQYTTLCSACHMPDGTGNQALGAPNLADRIWLYGGTTATIVESIANGRNGVMPAFEEFLGEDRIHLLTAYVYSLSHQFERE